MGQDFQLTDLKVRELTRTATTAAVEARFRNFGAAKLVVTHLQVVDGRWMIVNVRILADGFDLRWALRLGPAG